MNTDTNTEDLQNLIETLNDFRTPWEKCFLCGGSLLLGNYTEEHIIPRWAQKRYDLWNQQLVLLNQTSIPYRQLTVPCCDDCNRYRLKPIEDSLAQTVEYGRDAVLQLGAKSLFLWLGKIFYGILYKELSLLVDRRIPQGATIVTSEILERYRMHRLFLQQARETVEIVDFQPGSILVFSMQPLPQKTLEWDLCDNVETMFITCRVGRVGLIATLADGGAQQPFEEAYKDIFKLDLHPVQFRELCAQFSYRSTLATRTPKHIVLQGEPHKVLQLPLGGFSRKPIFEEWDSRTYAKFLSFYVGEKFEHLYSPPDNVITWLRDEKGDLRFLNFKDLPIMPGDYGS